MKSGLAAAMIAAAAIKRSGARLGGRLVVGALVDEEGDMIGAKPPLHDARSAAALTAAIICEPEQNELCLEQRGVVWARVTVRGRMAHGAMPEAGRESDHRARARCCARRRRSSAGCAGCAAGAPTCGPPTVTPDHRAGAGAGRAAVQRDSLGGPGHARRPADAGPGRATPSPRRSTSPASARWTRVPGRDGRVAAGQRVPAGHPGRAQRAARARHGARRAAGHRAGARASAASPARPTAPSSG